MSSIRRLSMPKVALDTEGPPKGTWDPPDAAAKVLLYCHWAINTNIAWQAGICRALVFCR